MFHRKIVLWLCVLHVTYFSDKINSTGERIKFDAQHYNIHHIWTSWQKTEMEITNGNWNNTFFNCSNNKKKTAIKRWTKLKLIWMLLGSNREPLQRLRWSNSNWFEMVWLSLTYATSLLVYKRRTERAAV